MTFETHVEAEPAVESDLQVESGCRMASVAHVEGEPVEGEPVEGEPGEGKPGESASAEAEPALAAPAEADCGSVPVETPTDEATPELSPSAAGCGTMSAFLQMGLCDAVEEAVVGGGYVTPTPIQAAAIPVLLEGRDILGQASTGTGKTAAFALPLLSRIDPADRSTQVLVLTPTRELAMQVAKSFRTYGHKLPDLTIQPIYGGASYFHQIKALERGVQIVVGTPGRVMDHMRRGTLKLDTLRCLVLDEGDEMLRMGFVDDVTWILEQTPAERQTALFSATMPEPIRRIAERHLKNPARITIREATTTATTVQARYVVCAHRDKPDVLHRVLETEDTEGVLVFVRTKEATVRIAETLAGHGFNAEALNGDMAQAQRERTVQQLKNGRLDIVVATDVAARGLDVQRISHVINFDVPHDTESYVHRIGRTGRAGRSGEAILFVTRNDIRRVRQIERETRQRMDEMTIPTAALVNRKRRADFLHRLTNTLESRDVEVYRSLIADLQEKSSRDFEDIAVALAAMLQGDRPFLMDERHDFANHQRPSNRGTDRNRSQHQDTRNQRFEHRSDNRSENRSENRFAGRPALAQRPAADRPAAASEPAVRPPQQQRATENRAATTQHVPANQPQPANQNASQGNSDDHAAPRRETAAPRRPAHRREPGMECFRIEVGREHGVEPGNIVGAIANEAGLAAKDIGRISIQEDHSFVDLPEGMPRQIFRQLKDVIVSGRHLRITRTQPYKPPFQKKRPAGNGSAKSGRPRAAAANGRKPARRRSE